MQWSDLDHWKLEVTYVYSQIVLPAVAGSYSSLTLLRSSFGGIIFRTYHACGSSGTFVQSHGCQSYRPWKCGVRQYAVSVIPQPQ